jgi:hypothetical protein
LRYGYRNVKDTALLAFSDELSRGAWGAIDLTGLVGEDGKPVRPLEELTTLVELKLRLTRGIGSLAKAIAASDATTGIELIWDNKQRAFVTRITLATLEGGAEDKKTAARILAALTAGGGLAQTGYSHDAEVDFGRKQIRLAAEPNLRADLSSLGLLPSIDEISVATENLAVAIGRDGSGSRKLSPSHQISKELSSCITSFTGVHSQLDWLAQVAASDEDRRRIDDLRKPMSDLLQRFLPEPTAAPSPTPTEEPL